MPKNEQSAEPIKILGTDRVAPPLPDRDPNAPMPHGTWSYFLRKQEGCVELERLGLDPGSERDLQRVVQGLRAAAWRKRKGLEILKISRNVYYRVHDCPGICHKGTKPRRFAGLFNGKVNGVELTPAEALRGKIGYEQLKMNIRRAARNEGVFVTFPAAKNHILYVQSHEEKPPDWWEKPWFER